MKARDRERGNFNHQRRKLFPFLAKKKNTATLEQRTTSFQELVIRNPALGILIAKLFNVHGQLGVGMWIRISRCRLDGSFSVSIPLI
jgi:hypothetical protein